MRILVGYNGSRIADAALEMGIKHAGGFDARLDIVYSLSPVHGADQKEIDKAETALKRVESLLKAKQIACETHLLIRGLEPGEDLVRFATKNSVDQIIIGVRRRSKVGKLMFGSTAQFVILNAACPVVTVKGQ